MVFRHTRMTTFEALKISASKTGVVSKPIMQRYIKKGRVSII